MPKRQLPLANNTESTLVCLVIATAAFLTVAFATRLASLSLLLIADSACLLIVGRAAGMRRSDGWRSELRGVAAYLAMLAAYTALGAALVGYPLHWLRNDVSLGVVLTISAASVLVLLVLWRVWPAFGLTAMDARHRHMSNGRTQRPLNYLAAASQLTANNEVFFGHGLLVSLALFALTQGALALSGWGAPIAPAARPAMLFAYAVLVLPFTWLVVQRAAIALLIDSRRLRADRTARTDAASSSMESAISPSENVSADLSGDPDVTLLRCVRAGQTQPALAALAHGADPNCVPPADDRDQRSALVLAALNPDIRLLRGFIAKGADLQRAHAGLPALIAATRDSSEGRPDAVMTLLTNGADANCADADGNTPLHFAALSMKPIVAALLCDAGACLDSVNREGQTPLARASKAANWELVRFLLERGAKPEVGQSQPALIAAAMIDEDDPQGVKLLLKRKVRVDARDALQRTALMTAALHGHAEIARALIEAGARLDAADVHGTTALMEAARADAHRVLDVLIPLRPPPDAIDHAGRSALAIAAQSLRSGEETVRRLLAFGISRQLAAKDGRRAVDFAAAAGRWNIVALIDPDYPRPSTLQGASVAPAAVDSPEHLLDALRFGHWQIVEKFSGSVRHWQPATLAQLCAELITHPNAAPRRWLLDHGLDANVSLHGVPLLRHALAQLPAALAAANDLVDAGAQAAGGDAVTQICAASAVAEQPQADLEALALRILELGAEKFRADRDGRTPLAQALANGWLRLCEALLAQGADPQARDRCGRTPLFAALSAAEPAREESIKLLLRAGADPEVRAANNETPLGLALARGHANLQRWLNWPGWKLPHRSLRATDVIAAASAGDVEAVGKLLELGLPADAVDGFGASPLLHAAGRGHADVVTLLLDRGANPAHAANDGATALSAAVAARQKTVVDLLLARGAGIDQPLSGGGTALMAAAGRGDIEMAGALLAHSAKVEAADVHGMCALHAAAQFAFAGGDAQNARRVFEMLLDAGAPVDARNADGQTALLILLGAHAPPRSGADQKALLGLLEVLRERGARIDVQDERGVGPLHACSMHGLLLPARALLAAGADRSCRDLLERTPREVAHRLGFVDVAAEIAGEAGRRWAI